MLAAVGQPRLMALYEQLFGLYGQTVGQVLLTRGDFSRRRSYLNARLALSAILEQGVVPIINENDTTATEEIRVGDNDNLSAMVAGLVDADLLLLLTDQPGLFTRPQTDPAATLIPEVRHIDAALRGAAGNSTSGLGVGGMSTKLRAADVARRAGTEVIIAAGRLPEVIARAAAGEAVGTRFPALEQPVESRKRWILAGPRPAGALLVDGGAAEALARGGKSLLPAGLRGVEGTFGRGDTVLILDPARQELARGISRCGNDLRRIAGCRSAGIIGRLGYAYGAVVVHRNDLILL
jgi:glutamate 5-kinase